MHLVGLYTHKPIDLTKDTHVCVRVKYIFVVEGSL